MLSFFKPWKLHAIFVFSLAARNFHAMLSKSFLESTMSATIGNVNLSPKFAAVRPISLVVSNTSVSTAREAIG